MTSELIPLRINCTPLLALDQNHNKQQTEPLVALKHSETSGVATGGFSGVTGPPIWPKDGPRDSFKTEEKKAGYRLPSASLFVCSSIIIVRLYPSGNSSGQKVDGGTDFPKKFKNYESKTIH